MIVGAIFTQRPPSVLTKQSLLSHIKGLLHPYVANRGCGHCGNVYLTIMAWENGDPFTASQPMMEPCCSSPQTLTCLFSDSGVCRRTPNVFASLKRDFRAQCKCVWTVSAFISWGGGRMRRKRTGPGSGVDCPVNTARSRATSVQKLLLTWRTAPGHSANLK